MNTEERRDQIRLIRAAMTLYAETAPPTRWCVVQTAPHVYELERV